MAVRDEVAALIRRLAGAPVCDECIADRLGLTVRGQAGRRTRELAGSDGFERRLDACSLCGTVRKAIRHAAGSA